MMSATLASELYVCGGCCALFLLGIMWPIAGLLADSIHRAAIVVHHALLGSATSSASGLQEPSLKSLRPSALLVDSSAGLKRVVVSVDRTAQMVTVSGEIGGGINARSLSLQRVAITHLTHMRFPFLAAGRAACALIAVAFGLLMHLLTQAVMASASHRIAACVLLGLIGPAAMAFNTWRWDWGRYGLLFTGRLLAYCAVLALTMAAVMTAAANVATPDAPLGSSIGIPVAFAVALVYPLMHHAISLFPCEDNCVLITPLKRPPGAYEALAACTNEEDEHAPRLHDHSDATADARQPLLLWVADIAARDRLVAHLQAACSGGVQGISLSGLKVLVAAVAERQAQDDRMRAFNAECLRSGSGRRPCSSTIKETAFSPSTAASKLSVLDTFLRDAGPELVGPATAFVSFSFGDPFAEVVDSLEAAAKRDAAVPMPLEEGQRPLFHSLAFTRSARAAGSLRVPTGRLHHRQQYYWYSPVCFSYHKRAGEDFMKRHKRAFLTVLARTGRLILVSNDFLIPKTAQVPVGLATAAPAMPEALSRFWCLWELYAGSTLGIVPQLAYTPMDDQQVAQALRAFAHPDDLVITNSASCFRRGSAAAESTRMDGLRLSQDGVAALIQAMDIRKSLAFRAPLRDVAQAELEAVAGFPAVNAALRSGLTTAVRNFLLLHHWRDSGSLGQPAFGLAVGACCFLLAASAILLATSLTNTTSLAHALFNVMPRLTGIGVAVCALAFSFAFLDHRRYFSPRGRCSPATLLAMPHDPALDREFPLDAIPPVWTDTLRRNVVGL